LSHYSVKPVEITLRASRLLAACLIVLHAVVLVLTLVMPLLWESVLPRPALVLALTASLAYHLAQHALRRLPGSVTGLNLALDGAFAIRRGGDWLPAEVLGSSFVHPHLTVLSLRLEGRRFATHVVLVPDALDAEAFRRLRVWLRWGTKVPSN